MTNLTRIFEGTLTKRLCRKVWAKLREPKGDVRALRLWLGITPTPAPEGVWGGNVFVKDKLAARKGKSLEQ